MILLRVLGSVDLEDSNGRELRSVLAQPKRLALLVYLAAAGPRVFHRRDTLLALFWPELDESHARRALNQGIRFLRKHLSDPSGVVVISRGADEVGINAGRLWCDASAFKAAAAQAGRNGEALDLYKGDFLQGFFVEAGPAFDEWLERERAQLRASAAKAARTLAEECERNESYTTAVASARRAVELSDDNERFVRELLELLDRLGDRAGAIHAYEEFARRLADEFAASPAAETEALIERIRARAVIGEQPGGGLTAHGVGKRMSPHAATAAPPQPSVLSPSVIAPAVELNGWRLERELGRGGMATVYLARDLKHDRPVAVKTMRPELTPFVGVERFLREIQITARLAHPHILPLIDSGIAEGVLYLVTPFVAGESLRSRLRRDSQLPVGDVIRLATEIAEALDFAHRSGIIHRDIKPENILLADGHALVADFGVARALVASAASPILPDSDLGAVVGSPPYMSPEQCVAGDVSARTDLYSLGCVIVEMLTGELPRGDESTDDLLAKRPDVPAILAGVVAACIARSPDRRPDSAAAVIRVFERANVDAGASAPQSGLQRLTSKQHLSRRQLLFGGAGALAAMSAVLVLLSRIPQTANVSTLETLQKLTSVGNAFQAAMHPDGNAFAYVIERGTGVAIVAQNLAGGRPDTLVTLGAAQTLEWSPDGTRLMAGGQSEAVIMKRPDGVQRRVPFPGPICPGVRAHWLPDSRRVSVHCGSGKQVFVINLANDSSAAFPVAGSYSWLHEGAWSADGRFFALLIESDDPVRWSIVTVAPNGQTELVVEDSVPIKSPRWSHDGQALYYARGDGMRRIAVSPRTGRSRGAAEDLLSQFESLARLPFGRAVFSVSRDERRIAYTRAGGFSNVVVVSFGDSGQPHIAPLTTGTTRRWGPAVSPNGRWIAFAEESQNGAELYRMPVEGGPAQRITSGARVWQPSQIAWSPDGSQLAFVSVRGGRGNVWVANVDASASRPLERTRVSIGRGQLSWAPGSEIAYMTTTHGNIGIVNPTTGNVRMLVPDSVPSRYLFSPQFAPDGNQLAVWWNRLRNRDPRDMGAWVFDLRKSSFKEIVSGPAFPVGWSRDGRYLYTTPLTSAQPLRRVDVAEPRNVRTYTKLPFRQLDCVPLVQRGYNDLACVGYEGHSDIWLIDNARLQAR